MKKLLLTTLTLLSAFTFIACDKPAEESKEEGYTLTITPTTVKVGETITIAITGEGAEDLTWYTCYKVTEGEGSEQCLMPGTTEARLSETGKYKFYSHAEADGKHINANNEVIVTVTE